MDALIALWPPETLALVIAGFFAAGIVKGTLGVGLPVVAIAILAPTIGLQAAVGLVLLPSIAMNVWQALVGGNFLELLRRLWSLMIMTVAGVWVGVQVLAAADAALLITVLAVVLIAYSLWSLSRAQVRPPGRWEAVLSPIVGFLAGLMFGMVGNFMVPGVIYHQALDLGRDRLVQALGMSFVVISVAMLVFMSRLALIDGATVAISAGAMVPGLLGMAIGQKLRRFLNERQFRLLFFLGLSLAGGNMLIRAWLV
ncbi:MAG: sulfite exporter TauE/SafE family protein [Hyphomicrobiaceae bacterium]